MPDDLLQNVMSQLKITGQDFHFEDESDVEGLKSKARRNLRSLAKTHHPDLTKDPHRVQIFRAATEVVADIEKTQYVPPRRRRKRRYSFTVMR